MKIEHLAAVVAVPIVAASLVACGSSNDSAAPNAAKLNVTLTDAGCSPAKLQTRSGPVTIVVSNGGTSKVSELELKNPGGIILGERENIVSGISGSFSLNLEPGKYVLSCPNGDTEDNGVLVVTGKSTGAAHAANAALLARATTEYKRYVEQQSDQLLAGTKQFVAALQAGDVAGAKALFGPVRAHYEAIEPVAESFGNLDPAIDARVNDVASPSQWTGFHRIEQILWQQNTTAGTAVYGKKLLADVTTLDQRVRTLSFQAAQLANGAVELLNEVANSKITGEEDRYSHTDLSDFAANVDGGEQAFDLLRPALVAGGEKQLADTVSARYAAVDQGLAKYKRGNGWAPYGALTAADRLTFAHQVDALAEALSTVAGKVNG